MIDSNNWCCGCGICEQVCPKDAVIIKTDSYGFKSAEIDLEKCIQCNLCSKRCPIQKNENGNRISPNYYAAVSKNVPALKRSSSGGAFFIFAQKVIEKKGIVFGCVFENKLKPVIKSSDNIEGIIRMQGSKYVEADVKNTFEEARKYLEDGRTVLYTGTPCKLAALRKYLNKEYERLICCEIICHGVTSETVFRDYINYLNHSLGGDVVDISFRDKRKGWGNLLKITYQKKDKLKIKYLSWSESSYYYYYYMLNASYGDSCYKCPFAQKDRESDITIGDFWGGRQIISGINPDNGVSAIIVSTKKGLDFFSECSNDFIYKETDFIKMSKENPNLTHPTELTNETTNFRKMFASGGFASIEDFHSKTHRKEIIKGRVKRIMPYFIIKCIRKLRGLLV